MLEPEQVRGLGASGACRRRAALDHPAPPGFRAVDRADKELAIQQLARRFDTARPRPAPALQKRWRTFIPARTRHQRTSPAMVGEAGVKHTVHRAIADSCCGEWRTIRR